MSANPDRPISARLSSPAQPAFRIELSLTIADAVALWTAARDHALGAPDAELDEIVEVIGPSEDPDLAACLAMLTAPAAIAGCSLDDYQVLPVHAVPAQAPANDLQLAKKAGASR